MLQKLQCGAALQHGLQHADRPAESGTAVDCSRVQSEPTGPLMQSFPSVFVSCCALDCFVDFTWHLDVGQPMGRSKKGKWISEPFHFAKNWTIKTQEAIECEAGPGSHWPSCNLSRLVSIFSLCSALASIKSCRRRHISHGDLDNTNWSRMSWFIRRQEESIQEKICKVHPRKLFYLPKPKSKSLFRVRAPKSLVTWI